MGGVRGETAAWWKGRGVKGGEGDVALQSPTDAPHVCPSFSTSFWAQYGSSLLGEAGRQSVMSCQQCSDGSLTYFRKYHRISIYNHAEQRVSSNIPHGPERSWTFSNVKYVFIIRRGLHNVCKKKGLNVDSAVYHVVKKKFKHLLFCCQPIRLFLLLVVFVV